MYETIRIVENLKPKYVIWENVKNILSKTHKHNFDNYIKIMENLGYKNYYKVLNAKDFGIPQNRERVFTISILNEKLFEFPKENNCNNKVIRPLKGTTNYGWHFEQQVFDENGVASALKAGGGSGNIPKVIQRFDFPEKQELQLRLKDLLENDVDEKYYLSDEQVGKIKASSFVTNSRRIQEKDCCDTLCARDWKDPKCVKVCDLDIKGYDCEKRVYADGGISPTITTRSSHPKILIKNATKKGFLEGEDGDGCYISNIEKKRGTVQKNLIPTLKTSLDVGVIIGSTQEHAAISKDGIVPTLSSAMGMGGGQVPMHNYSCRIRKLTPKECWRLMGFTDEEFEKAAKVNSNTQLYKQAGNSIVVNVLIEILRNLLKENVNVKDN